MTGRPALRSLPLQVFLGFFLLAAAWAFAAPFNGAPDEFAHIYRAAGVTSGQLAPEPVAAMNGTGAFQDVPRGLLRPNPCWQAHPLQPASCAREPGSDRTKVRTATSAGRYNPLYYALVGWPISVWPGWSGVYLTRLLSAALAAALLAGAAALAARRRRPELLIAALVLGVTPMALSLFGAVNPNGVEIAAAAAFYTALLTLVAGERSPDRLAPIVLALSGVVLVEVRSVGPLWVATALAAAMIGRSRTSLREAVASRASRVALGVVAAAGASSLLWTLTEKAASLGHPPITKHYSFSQALLLELDRLSELFGEAIGVTSWLDVRMPAPLYLAWEALLLMAVAVLALVGDRRTWLRIGVVSVGGLLVPLAIEVKQINTVGLVTQGRYLLPSVLGLLVLAAFELDSRVDRLPARRFAVGSALVVLPIQGVCLVYSMARWQHGLAKPGVTDLGDLNPFTGTWHPPGGSALPLACAGAGLLLLTWLVAQVSPPATRSPR